MDLVADDGFLRNRRRPNRQHNPERKVRMSTLTTHLMTADMLIERFPAIKIRTLKHWLQVDPAGLSLALCVESGESRFSMTSMPSSSGYATQRARVERGSTLMQKIHYARPIRGRDGLWLRCGRPFVDSEGVVPWRRSRAGIVSGTLRGNYPG